MRASDHAGRAHGHGAAGVDFHKQWGGEGFGCSGWAWAKAKAGVAIMRPGVLTLMAGLCHWETRIQAGLYAAISDLSALDSAWTARYK